MTASNSYIQFQHHLHKCTTGYAGKEADIASSTEMPVNFTEVHEFMVIIMICKCSVSTRSAP